MKFFESIFVKITVNIFGTMNLCSILYDVEQKIIISKRFSLSIIYLPRVLCLSYSCHPVTIAERSAILLVLIITLTQETRQRD